MIRYDFNENNPNTSLGGMTEETKILFYLVRFLIKKLRHERVNICETLTESE
jgi:hypothetical protein